MELTKEYFDSQLGGLEKRLEDRLDEKLAAFATKEYLDGKLSNFATKDDLKLLATKEDIEKGLEYIAMMVSDTIASPMTKTFEKIHARLQLTEGPDEPLPWLLQDKSPFEKPYPSLFAQKWAEHKELEAEKKKNREKLKKFKL